MQITNTRANTSYPGVYDQIYDEFTWTIKLPGYKDDDNSVYILADLNIGGYITQLRWDVDVAFHNAILYQYLNAMGHAPVIQKFNYQRAIHHPVRIMETNVKDIHIFIEKKYFEQLPTNASANFNPFEAIIQQQFYEVAPDPRECTTITTDHSIYSSKIIWADNIMTMRRDVNVMGGTVEVLQYDYAALKQTVDSLREMLRLQAAYNEYISSIQKGIKLMNSVLQILSAAVSIASTVSTLTMSGDELRIDAQRNEDFHYGNGFGGGGGFPGGGFPGDDTDLPGGGNDTDLPDISGDFGFTSISSADCFRLSRYMPSTSSETEAPLLGAVSTLTATNLALSATNALTSLGDVSASLTANQLTFTRLPETTVQNVNVIQQVHTITDSSRELTQRTREESGNVITVVEVVQRDGIELELQDIEQPTEQEQPDVELNREEAPIEPNQLQLQPATTLSATTVTTVQVIEPNNISRPIITDNEGHDYLLSELAGMTYEQLSALIPNVAGLTITSHVRNRLLHTYTLYYQGEQIVQRRWNRDIVVFTPSVLQYSTTLHRQTTSHWWIESNGRELRAITIERLSEQLRSQLDVVQDNTIYFISNGNQETGEAWTEIHESGTNRLLAMIDYTVPVHASFTGTHISFTTPFTRQLIDPDGIHMNWDNDNQHSSIELTRDGLTLERDAVIPTESDWTVPGHQPIVTAADIERMDSDQRYELALEIESHGNVLHFITNNNEHTGETWTDIEYDGEIVARIDQRVRHHIRMDGTQIVIGTLHERHVSFGQRGLRWFRYQVTGVDSEEDATISGIIGEIATRTVHNVVSGFWSWVVHNPRDAVGAYAMLHMARGSVRGSSIFMPLRHALNPIMLQALDDETPEATIQQLLDWCLDEGEGTEVDISLEHADEMVVSFATCMNIAQTFRDSLKGPLALICSKIQDIEENGVTSKPASTSDIESIESRIVELERKTANIEPNTTTTITGELTLANLLKSYDERLTALEKKTANIE